MKIDIRKVISDLRNLAEAKGVSLSEICRRAGVNRATISRWETTTAEPSIRIINKLFEAGEALPNKIADELSQ